MTTQRDIDTDIATKLKTPKLYKVVLMNDDYTPMEFVIQLLQEVFAMGYNDAHQLCMDVHKHGRGIAGIYSREVADQKVVECNHIAKEYKHPLKTISEVV